MASLSIGFLVEKYVACQSRKSDFGWHRFVFVFHLAWLKSLKRFWPYLIASTSCIPNGNLSSYCICVCFFNISNFMKPSAVYEASLCMFELRFEIMIWPIVCIPANLRRSKIWRLSILHYTPPPPTPECQQHRHPPPPPPRQQFVLGHYMTSYMKYMESKCAFIISL